MPQPLLPPLLGFLRVRGKAEAQDLVDELGVSKVRARSMLREARKRHWLARVSRGVWRLRRGVRCRLALRQPIAAAGAVACSGSG